MTPSTSPCPTLFADKEPAHTRQGDVTKSALALTKYLVSASANSILFQMWKNKNCNVKSTRLSQKCTRLSQGCHKVVDLGCNKLAKLNVQGCLG